MSLFENSKYQYRETYFLLFRVENRPDLEVVVESIKKLSPRFEVSSKSGEGSNFGAITLISKQDNAAMDITYVEGEEVTEQVDEINEQFKTVTVTGDDLDKLGKLKGCNARLDVFHFEYLAGGMDEMLDPAALLMTLDTLGELTDGVAIDPQSLTLM